MSVAFSIKEDSAGLWRVCLSATVTEGLTLERAIKEAGKLARQHHARTGVLCTVQLEVAGEVCALAQYAPPVWRGGESAAA
ncbi:MAG TPA: hypothetical protein VGU65_12620 [Frateuria sp.]|uniref:hypothetical protein n=1 Tax=Frateuria sp. TaxID=2211372 RepID=UPI002DE96CF2|nr:hypothetical protein [Frateuria sp.]